MSLLEIPIIPPPSVNPRNPTRYLDEIWQTHFADVSRVNQLISPIVGPGNGV